MTWLIPKLTHRVQVGTPVQTPNDDGGLDFSFNTVKTVWMGFKPLGYKGTGSKYIRSKQISEIATHRFVCRHKAVASLGNEFAGGFSNGFDSIEDIMPVKSDYFLFVQHGLIIHLTCNSPFSSFVINCW